MSTERTLIEQDIVETRERLADTVAELSERMDVKARARNRIRTIPAYVPIALGTAAIATVALVVWRKRS